MGGKFHSPAFLLPAGKNPNLLPAMMKKECESVTVWGLMTENPPFFKLYSLLLSYSKVEMMTWNETSEFSS
jgi:hypothetical protein